MAFAKFQGNRFRIDRVIAENHAILVNLTASIKSSRPNFILFNICIRKVKMVLTFLMQKRES